jgi:hypothetical protein
MCPRGRDQHQRPRGLHLRSARGLPRALVAALLAASAAASAFTVNITRGPQEIYLQIGVGSFNGLFDNGGTPLNNTTVNQVSVTVPAASVGNGTAQAMTTNSTQSNSFWDNFVFCNAPTQLYIGGFYRTANNGNGSVSVTATVPAALSNGNGGTIPFSQISWTSSGNGDAGGQPFPAGTFTAGGTQAVGTISQNQWAESCWTYSYLNTVTPAAGTFTGRVTYTLSAP